ncbi:MAG: SMP-30/gluconolactonase/LRE family protein, partial [Planctomycetota bacterium]
TPEGDKLGHIHLPEGAANLCFGGVKRNRLLITASQSIYALYVEAQGLPY